MSLQFLIVHTLTPCMVGITVPDSQQNPLASWLRLPSGQVRQNQSTPSYALGVSCCYYVGKCTLFPETASDMTISPTEEPHLSLTMEFNQAYSSPDADMILIACDGEKFRVHSTIMAWTSGFFKSMLSLPEAPVKTEMGEPTSLQEDGEVLKAILDIAYPDRTFFDSRELAFDLFNSLCFTAEKYEMPSVMDSLRIFLRATFRDYPPISAYALACRYDWEKEAKMASTATLFLNLMSQEVSEQLKLAPTDGIMRLLQLHHSRRSILNTALELGRDACEGPLSISWSSILLIPCPIPWSHCSTPRLTVLKFRISEQMERTPDGSFLRLQDFWDRDEFKRLWEFSCNCHCGYMIDKDKLKREVVRVLGNLPDTV